MRRPLLLLPVAALLSVLAISGRTEKTAAAAHFSDRQIFEGVMFGIGPVASVLPEAREQLRPELYARNTEELAAMSAARAEVIASIERAEPGFIGEFARVARSGDPAAIRSMLERAADVVNRAADIEVRDGTLFANIPRPTDRGLPSPARPGPGCGEAEPGPGRAPSLRSPRSSSPTFPAPPTEGCRPPPGPVRAPSLRSPGPASPRRSGSRCSPRGPCSRAGSSRSSWPARWR